MNQINLADLQMIAALNNAAHPVEQAQQTQHQQATAAFSSLSSQQSSQYSRRLTPPMSSANSPKVSTNTNRNLNPTQNGIPQSIMISTAAAPPPNVSFRTPTATQNGFPQSLTSSSAAKPNVTLSAANNVGQALDPHSRSKYQHLLSVIEEMSQDIRPSYAGSKSSAARLTRAIVYARILVRECLVETERSARN